MPFFKLGFFRVTLLICALKPAFCTEETCFFGIIHCICLRMHKNLGQTFLITEMSISFYNPPPPHYIYQLFSTQIWMAYAKYTIQILLIEIKENFSYHEYAQRYAKMWFSWKPYSTSSLVIEKRGIVLHIFFCSKIWNFHEWFFI